eukprot:Gb_00540 [translate_table: standard]
METFSGLREVNTFSFDIEQGNLNENKIGNPPKLHTSDVYKVNPFNLMAKLNIKKHEVTGQVKARTGMQIAHLPVFSEKEIESLQK